MSVLASSSEGSTHDPPHGALGHPVVVIGAFPHHVEPILIFAIVIYFIGCPVTVIIVVGVMELFPSRTGTFFFICVYFVEGLDDLV